MTGSQTRRPIGHLLFEVDHFPLQRPLKIGKGTQFGMAGPK